MMKRLALALTALIAFAAPTLFGGARNIGAAHAQAPTGNPTISSVLSGGKRTLCVYIRGTTACDPISAFDTTSGAMTVLGVGIDMQAAAQAITTTPYAGDVPRTTSFALKGESKLSLLTNFLATFSIRCKTGAGQPIGVNEGCVAGYFDTEAQPGSSQAWGVNINVVQRANFFANGGNSVIGAEVNMNNFDHDNGNFDGDIAGVYPSSVAFGITGIGGHTISAAISISTDGSKEFNRGVAFSPGSITQCSICDYNSGAATVIDIRGAHSAYGIDGRTYSGGPFIRIASQQAIVGRNVTDNADMQLLATDANNQVNIGVGGGVGKVIIYGGGTAGLSVNSTSVQINSISTAGVIVSDATGLLSSAATLPAARFPVLTGDVTTLGGSLATTLATVNANVGTFGSSTAIATFTVDGKGRITAASTNAVIAPAGTLTGTTLASNVVTSSLTAVGTLTAGATGAGFTVNFGTSTFSGTIPAANTAALTGDVTKSAGSNATTIAAINLGTATITGTLPAANTAALTGDVTKSAGSNATTLATTQGAVHTWSLAQTFTVAPVFTDQSGSRTALGLGTAATQNTGTSGATIPVLNAANTFSGLETFSAGIAVTSNPSSVTTLDASGQPGIVIANGANQPLPTINGGFLIVEDISTGHEALFLLAGSPPILVSSDSNWQASTTPSANNSGIGWNGSAYTIYNNTGGSHTYKVVSTRVH